MLRSRVLSAALVAVVALALTSGSMPASSQVTDVTVPSIGTPVGSTPSISIPSVESAAAQTPSAPAVTAPIQAQVSSPTVPAVTVPSVQASPVQTPTISSPTVTTPSVTTPSVTTPSVTTSPITPAGATAPVPGSTLGAAPGATGVTPPHVAAPSGSLTARTTGNTTSGVTQAPAGGGPPTLPSALAASVGSDIALATGELPGSTPAQRLLALRRAVRALRGCLTSLPATERKVLELRAGLGLDRPRTRKRVAELTHLSLEQVRRLERSGLRHLRSLGNGGCGVAPSTTAIAFAPALPTLGADLSGGEVQVLGERTAGGNAPSADDAASRQPQEPMAGSGEAMPDLALLLIPIVVLAFLVFAAKEIRRMLTRT